MVEKIDKPEVPPAYYIQSTTETKDDRGGSGGQQQAGDEYSGSHAQPGWQKIYAQSSNRRYMKIRREDIQHAWFRTTVMQRGVSLVEADIEIKDGKILKGAHIILPTRESFWTLKRFQPGQSIPLNMIVNSPILEISLPSQPFSGGGTTVSSGTKIEASINRREKRWDKNKILIYAGTGIVILFLILFFLTR